MNAFDIRALTMEDAVELTGQKRPPTVTRTEPYIFTCDVPGHDCAECREGHVNAGTDPTCGPICRECGGDLTEGFIEITGRDAYLHDYSRLVRYCEDCLEVADDD